MPDFNHKRCRLLTKCAVPSGQGPVLYWMSRDQRVQDNWALIYAQKLALKRSVPLMVCFCLVPKFLDATIRQFGFMLKGLREVEQELQKLKVPFSLLMGMHKEQIPLHVSSHAVSAVVCDFSPLKVPMGWVTDVGRDLEKSSVPLVQVDAHNIVPCWLASDHLEYAARTIRPKIHAKLPEFLVKIPALVEHPYPPPKSTYTQVDWAAADASLQVDRTVEEVSWAIPGYKGGMAVLEDFCTRRLKDFHSGRNNPNLSALSNLSPWFHFGQISIQRSILRVKECQSAATKPSVDAFVEEAVVRRELADNFCFYNPKYDSLDGASGWAQETLRLHEGDKREHLYSQEQFEKAETHDDLWNAAQLQMVRDGKMHGFLRMYWAKKILQWSPSPSEALRVAIWLNDKYELDGRDPNGYVGCMWSICGIHDQGWAERSVFGKIRYMCYDGCKRKFDVPAFVSKYRAQGMKKNSETTEGPLDKLLLSKPQGRKRKLEDADGPLDKVPASKERKR